MKEETIRQTVREEYGRIAEDGSSCCCSCSCTSTEEIGEKIGYSRDEMEAVPEGANLGLGCGNPTAHAAIKEGEVIVDLGSGAGFDCFLAARKTGASGKVIGVDMTPQMLERARENARKGGYGNVEFRLGEIENLPVADNHADKLISNCVINLSPDMQRVFCEAFRILKPGGTLYVTDIVLVEDLPAEVRESVTLYVGCIAGALLKDDYLKLLEKAGFTGISLLRESPLPYEAVERTGVPLEQAQKACDSARSIMVCAEKPLTMKGAKVMKKVEILGPGCPNCTKLYEMTREAAGSLGIDCDIEKVQDMNRILGYNILATPALVVDGEVKVAGRLPTIEEIKKHISA
jgi:arsenite methyltransferase